MHKLQTLDSIRSTNILLQHPECLQNFILDLSKLDTVITDLIDVIHRDYPSVESIPAHSRWRHLDAGTERIQPLIQSWAEVEKIEKCKRILDLFVVSVLLDAGAGDTWSFTETGTGRVFTRSEGLGVASFELFMSGILGSKPFCVDSLGLSKLTLDQFM
jgi:hypothetical protein